MKLDRYEELRHQLVDLGYGKEIEWAESVQAPESPEALWREYAWVIINSGMKNQIAEKIWDKVRPEVEGGGSARNVFGHIGKASAIDFGWTYRAMWFRSFTEGVRRGLPPLAFVEWCESLPWIGPITKWHLAKNLGVDCAKPDRWLERVAAASTVRPGETVQELCERLSHASGDRVATVDLVIWRACNLGLVAL